MRRLYLFFLVTINISFASTSLLGQGNSVKLTVKLLEGYCTTNPTDNEGSGDWRWKIFFNGTQKVVGHADNAAAGVWYPLNLTVVSDYVLDLNTTFKLGIEGWEEDYCGSENDYNTCNIFSNGGDDDDQHCGLGEADFNNSANNTLLLNMHAGNYTGASNVVSLSCGEYYVKFLITYKPSTPAAPTFKISGVDYPRPAASGGAFNLCLNDSTLELSTLNALKNYLGEVNYTWQYRVNNETSTVWVSNPAYCGDTNPDCSGGGGTQPLSQMRQKSSKVSPLVAPPTGGDPPPCCYEDPYLETHPPYWRTVSGTSNAAINGGKMTISNIRSLPGLQNITANSIVQFKVVAIANGLSGDYSSIGPTINLSPLPPKIKYVDTQASCPNTNTGIIHVKEASGLGKYHYNLRPGFGNNQPCSPDGNTCFGSDVSGSTSGQNFDILNVPPGDYTLWIINIGSNVGSCYYTKDVSIDKVQDLVIQLSGKKDVTCFDGSDGAINLTSLGGLPAMTFSIRDSIGNITSNATGIFSGLKSSNYFASVVDQCLQDSVIQVRLTQPVNIAATSLSTNPNCNSPADGEITINTTRGPGLYNYYIRQGSVNVDSLIGTTNLSWSSSKLGAGSYTVKVKDSQRLSCDGYTDTKDLIAPTVLSLATSNFLTDSVSCNNGGDGKIKLHALDMSGTYKYIIEQGAIKKETTTDSVFSNLTGGSYAVSIKRNLQCDDVFTLPQSIVVNQPTQVVSSLVKQDISCFGLNDGKIFSTVSGGSGSVYTYTWETFLNSDWSSLSQLTPDLGKLIEGQYRLKANDKKHCTGISNEVTIIEPAKLLIDTVAVHDIVCFNEKGTIALTPSGGTKPYSYEYSLNNGSFESATDATPLDAGNYTVAVKDNNGCRYENTDIYTITSPPSALSFTHVLSDYNGFNISCYGGNNGFVTLTPSGGNGASYSGYQYAADANPFQDAAKVENINAGTHAIHIRDGRGCIVSEDILFIQTDEQLSAQLIEKQDVVCFGDKTGILEIAGGGGLPPYQYSVNASANQSTGRFINLIVGEYDFTVTDKNNCSAVFIQEIASINPVIRIQSTVKDVNCFDGADGLINAIVSGGVPPFQYQWLGQSSTTDVLSGIKTGTYTVRVTDNAGCKMDSSIFVGQPSQALKIGLLVLPVCYGKTDGSISIAASGGTLPYEYSIDEGQNYQSSFLFQVGVGNYPATAKDKNGCTATQQAEVIQRNDKPEPNFLAATKRSALDTLVITEISIPKPDSVFWIFNPQPVMIDDNVWAPLIKYNEPGTYSITLTGFFGGCDYSITKDLFVSPFDPNAIPDKSPGYRAIQSVSVTPNPSSGEFEVTVTLNKKRNLSLLVYDMIGSLHYNTAWEEVEGVKQKITLDNVSSGVYLLRVITETDAEDIRIIINK